MEIFAWIALIVLMICGYSWYRAYQDRALTKRLKAMRDKDLILQEMDTATEELKAEGDFWRRNRSKF
ncbi:MAG TPA: hypothetical protein VKU00_01810 [Chthonomonadaceae bacterium]|nr:hypothetical protein [Chthonomonadaceae bacterium]